MSAGTPPRVAALVPCHDDEKVGQVVARILPHVDETLLVGDAPVPAMGDVLDVLAGDGVRVVTRPPPAAKGSAVALGTRILLGRPSGRT